MSLDRELLEQAKHLATREPRRPKQASLRRSVSAAYYALFHLLIREASDLLAPRSPPHLRQLLTRAFEHGDMKQAARSFAAGSLSAHHPGIRPSPDLSSVASTFIDLQQARHDADYNLSAKLSRPEVLLRVREVERAFLAWKNVRGSDEAKVFLTSLLVEKQWRRRQ